jgi:hypothetical protein
VTEFKFGFRTPITAKNEKARTSRAFHFFVAGENAFTPDLLFDIYETPF